MVFRVGLIGLGIMGLRMLDRLAQHPGLAPAAGWDPDPDACARAMAAHPDLAIASSPEALCARADLACVYIASPPASHGAHAFAAFDAGKAAFIEKPLTTGLAEGRAIAERVALESRSAAVNFSLGQAPGLKAMEQAVRNRRFGKPVSASVDVQFAAWPRPWQMGAASWLAKRAEGGFTREVVSHFVFLLQRVLGEPEIGDVSVSYPAGDGAETALTAHLSFGGVPVTIHGKVGGTELPDRNMTTLTFETGAIRLTDWTNYALQEGGHWVPSPETPEALRQAAQVGQLDELALMLAGKPHRLPSVAEGLVVQTCVEGLLG
jgi:predicted dehydrogenase